MALLVAGNNLSDFLGIFNSMSVNVCDIGMILGSEFFSVSIDISLRWRPMSVYFSDTHSPNRIPVSFSIRRNSVSRLPTPARASLIVGHSEAKSINFYARANRYRRRTVVSYFKFINHKLKGTLTERKTNMRKCEHCGQVKNSARFSCDQR